MNALQADCGQGGQPDAAAEVRVRERRTGRGGEDESGRRGEPGQVLTQIGHDQVGEVHVPHAGSRLGRPERVAGLVVVKLPGDLYGAGVQVDVRGAKRGDFCPPEASEGGQQDQCPEAEQPLLPGSVQQLPGHPPLPTTAR